MFSNLLSANILALEKISWHLFTAVTDTEEHKEGYYRREGKGRC